MQMWNMVIAGGNTQTARGDGAGAPMTSIEATHGMPVGEYQPGMRGHITNPIAGLENGVGPSYGPGSPYTRTNNQNDIESIVKGTARSEYGSTADSMPGRSISTMAPPGQTNPQASRPDQTTVNTSSAAASTVGVGTGQSARVIRPVELPGATVSTGGKPAVASIMEQMMSASAPPQHTTYEDYTQQALQDEPTPTNPQAERGNNRNANRVNGRRNPSLPAMYANYATKPAGTGRPMPRGSGSGPALPAMYANQSRRGSSQAGRGS